MNINSTKYYSNKQEKRIAKTVGGKKQPNSGATMFNKGDVVTTDWLFEAKTCVTEKQSFSIKKSWLDKLENEAFGMNKEFYALVFDFGIQNGENFYILNERTFKQILTLINELES